ncbi:MAG TPA: hypothetical protein VNK03_07795 [Gammaproteobacteria bacterium]|nr:hypothetical protein [Gammaproteobacteria bacterium]
MQLINFKGFNSVMIILSLSIMVSGCGGDNKWFRDRSNDYKNAECYPTIQIPSDVNADSFSSEYRIPER